VPFNTFPKNPLVFGKWDEPVTRCIDVSRAMMYEARTALEKSLHSISLS